jgi:hypothetical protein
LITFQASGGGAGLDVKRADYIPFDTESKEKGGTGQIPVPPR